MCFFGPPGGRDAQPSTLPTIKPFYKGGTPGSSTMVSMAETVTLNTLPPAALPAASRQSVLAPQKREPSRAPGSADPGAHRMDNPRAARAIDTAAGAYKVPLPNTECGAQGLGGIADPSGKPDTVGHKGKGTIDTVGPTSPQPAVTTHGSLEVPAQTPEATIARLDGLPFPQPAVAKNGGPAPTTPENGLINYKTMVSEPNEATGGGTVLGASNYRPESVADGGPRNSIGVAVSARASTASSVTVQEEAGGRDQAGENNVLADGTTDLERGEPPTPSRDWNFIFAIAMVVVVLPLGIGGALWAYKADGNQISTGYTALGGLAALAALYAKFLRALFE